MTDIDHIRDELSQRHTHELVEILVHRDEEEWRPEVFALIEEELQGRGVAVAEAVQARHDELSAADPAESVETHPVVLDTFDDPEEAQLCRILLAQAGVLAKLEEATETDDWELYVDESQLEAAHAVLERAEQHSEEEGEAQTFQCSSCGFIAEPIQEGSSIVCQVCGEADGGPRG